MVKMPEWVEEKKRRGRRTKYGFDKIEIGATLAIPVDEQSCTFASFRVMAYARARKLGRKFYVRENPETKAFEVWRES